MPQPSLAEMLQKTRAAGLTVWRKEFQHLRSSRETELAEMFPLHVVTAWLGNSQPVALKHYLQVTDTHFAAATAPEKAARNPARRVRRLTIWQTLTPSPGLPAPGSDADPILMRFLDAWHRLCDADRLRLVDDAERPANST